MAHACQRCLIAFRSCINSWMQCCDCLNRFANGKILIAQSVFTYDATKSAYNTICSESTMYILKGLRAFSHNGIYGGWWRRNRDDNYETWQ